MVLATEPEEEVIVPPSWYRSVHRIESGNPNICGIFGTTVKSRAAFRLGALRWALLREPRPLVFRLLVWYKMQWITSPLQMGVFYHPRPPQGGKSFLIFYISKKDYKNLTIFIDSGLLHYPFLGRTCNGGPPGKKIVPKGKIKLFFDLPIR
jgi:hypothetical protein